ncbi:sulfatase [Chloroflexota bacterium]
MNVIWITADTFRRDYMGAYGNKTIHTPSLDALAAKSVRFDNHYAASFPTMPARADFLTGRWTMSFMKWAPLPKEEIVLGELLSNKGIHTAAVVDTPFYVRNAMGYDRGFRTFTEIPGQLHHPVIPGTPLDAGVTRDTMNDREPAMPWHFESDCFAPRTFTESMRWLSYHYKEDFFLYIDTWDPHEPWDAPAYYTERYLPGYDGEVINPIYGFWHDDPGYSEEKVRKLTATYCGEVTMVDTWVGYFLRQVENMGLMENTAIIFSTDHGFYFGEHGGMIGKSVVATDPNQDNDEPTNNTASTGVWARSPLYQELLANPLLIYLPDTPPTTYSGLTSAVDLMPTVLDIMGVDIPSAVEGKSLLPMVQDRTLPGREYVIGALPFVNAGETMRTVDDVERRSEWASGATITTDEWELLYDVEPGFSELYNLKSDPKQEKNVIQERPEVAREIHSLFVDFMKDTKMAEYLVKPRSTLRL